MELEYGVVFYINKDRNVITVFATHKEDAIRKARGQLLEDIAEYPELFPYNIDEVLSADPTVYLT